MWYLPFLRARKLVVIYTLAFAAIMACFVAWRYWPGHGFSLGRQEGGIDGWGFTIIGSVIAAGFATALGLHLAAENDGHLELAWTQPTSRIRSALTIIGIDIVALFAIELLTVAILTLGADAMYGRSIVVYDGSANVSISGHIGRIDDDASPGKSVTVKSASGKTLAVVKSKNGVTSVRTASPLRRPRSLGEEISDAALFMTFPLSVYAWIIVVSASLKRNRGTVAAIFWPAALGLTGVANIPIESIRWAAGIINLVNPVHLYSSTGDFAQRSMSIGVGLALLMLALAVAQWQRLEA